MISKNMKKIIRKLNGANATERARNDILNTLTDVRQELNQINERVSDLKNAHEALVNQVAKRHDVAMRSLRGYRYEVMLRRDTSKPAVYILATHDFGNIGDLAIGYSQKDFIKSIFPNTEIYEVSRLDLLSNWSSMLRLITSRDLIVLPGGGNMGDIWGGEESVRRTIVQSFAHTKIISFPQSIKFYDEKELKKSADIYNHHSNMMIATRDDVSYELATKYFSKVRNVRTSDIVMSYRYPASDRSDTDSITFVMRTDKEKNATSGVDALYKKIEDSEYSILNTDTVDADLFGLDDNSAAFLTYTKIDLIHTSRLVVTDRLHGALFALLAKRPVIVFDNSYGKIKGALKDIKNEFGDWIVFADDNGENVDMTLVDKMYNMGPAPVTLADVTAKDFKNFATEILKFNKGK